MNPAIVALLTKLLRVNIFQDLVKVMVGTVGVQLVILFFNALKKTPSAQAVSQLNVDPGSFIALMDKQLSRGDITQDGHTALVSLYSDSQSVFPLTSLIAPAAYMWQYTNKLSEAVNGAIYQDYNKRFRPNAVPLNLVANSLHFKSDPVLDLTDVLQRHGLSDTDIGLLSQAMRTPLAADSVLQVLLNGKIDNDTALLKLQDSGLSEGDAQLYLESAPDAPVPSTLETLISPQVTNDSIALALGLDDNIPDSITQWLIDNGLSEKWGKFFWRAHYQLPPIDVFYQALNRGMLQGFDPHGYYEAIGIPPALYDIMDQLSTVPISMLQAAEALQNGIIGPDTFRNICEENGYSSDAAEILLSVAQSTLNSNVTSSTITAIQYAVSDGFMTDDQAIGMFKNLGYTESQAQLQVQLAHYQAAYDYAKSALSAIEKSFKAKTIDGNTANSEIIALGIQASTANGYITLWAKEAASEYKAPTMTDIQDMLKYGIINESQAITYIVQNGYNATTAAQMGALMIARNGGK